jgi:hypothetical protein
VLLQKFTSWHEEQLPITGPRRNQIIAAAKQKGGELNVRHLRQRSGTAYWRMI